MAEPRWTVLVVPHGPGRSRSVEVSRPAIRVILGSVLAIPLAALVLGYTTVSRSADLAQLDRLERRNRLLAGELQSTQTTIAQLTDTMEAIVKRDSRVRLLAGLEPTDPDVQQAGIGGPSGAPSQHDVMLSEDPLGQSALKSRFDVATLLRRANLLIRSYNEVTDSLEVYQDRMSRTPSIMPTSGWLTSRFAASRIHPIHGEARRHEGIDVSTPMGTPISATAGGIVTDVGNETGYGLVVTIDHGYQRVTRYAHCSKILVRVGQRVKRGEKIALVGNTGISTGPHLHYEVIIAGRHQDPRDFIFPETIVD